MERLRKLSRTDINQMKGEELKKLLKHVKDDAEKEPENLVDDEDDDGDVDVAQSAVMKMLMKLDKKMDDMKMTLRSEMQTMKGELEKKITKDVEAAVQKKYKGLEEENRLLREALDQHQKYLEALENEKRAKNIIFLGIPEQKPNDRTTDEDKCSEVLITMGKQAKPVRVQRIGQVKARGNRPLRVELDSREDRDDILESSKTLKGTPNFNKVFIKKDQHPMVVREVQRLKKVSRDESQKPENEGRKVEYDGRHRRVTIDGVVVDSFRPAFFAERGMTE
jgi:hypothetical protein